MTQTQKLVIATLLTSLVITVNSLAIEPDQSTADLEQLSASQLEQRLVEIDGQLERLSQYSPRSGVGSIGYRSKAHTSDANPEWIQVDFGKEYSIDEVVLVPTIWRDTVRGYRADAFPIEFRIVVGVGSKKEGTVVASFDASDRLLPRIAPLHIPCGGITASWVRVEVDTLSPRQYDGKYLLQLAEILVFSGEENVALRKPLRTSSDEPSGSPAWEAKYATDGFMPYLMNGAVGDLSLAFVSEVGIGDEPSLTIDLGESQSLSHAHLHVVDQSDTVPQSHTGDFGIPRLLRIEGANQKDFSDAKVLVEYVHETMYDVGPVVMLGFSETNCRYVRLTANDPYIFSSRKFHGSRIGFAEIELLSHGKNVALGKLFHAVFDADSPVRSLAALTDGHNHYGRILPVREWLAELAKRHDLEAARPLVEAELNDRYLRQKENFDRLLWLVGLLGLGVVCTILIERIIRQRAIFQTREHIAADLHDEIGANIHAIGLLGDLAKASSDAPEKLEPLLERMRELTERTGTAAGYCANMLESKGLYDDLAAEMRRSSARILADLDHEISFEGEEVLASLKPRRRIDLFLFYKECLTNILRHSGATHVSTQLKADSNELSLTVTDNGCGWADSAVGNGVPPSLKRRARLIGGRVSTEHSQSEGTSIHLRLRLRRFGMAK